MSLLSRMNAAANEEASLQQSLAYDYSRVAEANRPAIIAAALEIKPRLKRASEDLVEVGKQLNAVKDRLPHGAWEDWLNEEFALTVRTAQNFMNVAERFDGKSEIISLLSSTVAYQLAAPSTPAAAVAEVVATAQASGKRPSVAETKAVIARHKPQPEINYAPAHMHAAGWGIAKMSDTHWRVRIPGINDPKMSRCLPGVTSLSEALADIQIYYNARQVVIAQEAPAMVEPTAEPTTTWEEMQPPPDLAAHGWTLRKSAGKWRGHVVGGDLTTAMLDDVPAAVAAMRAMEAERVRVVAPPPPKAPTLPASVPAAFEAMRQLHADASRQVEIEGLIALYSEAHRSLPIFDKIMGYTTHITDGNLFRMIRQLEEKLRELGGQS